MTDTVTLNVELPPEDFMRDLMEIKGKATVDDLITDMLDHAMRDYEEVMNTEYDDVEIEVPEDAYESMKEAVGAEMPYDDPVEMVVSMTFIQLYRDATGKGAGA